METVNACQTRLECDLLRTTRRAIYAMIERRQLPGVIRVRRRVLLRADDLLDWLNQKRAPSPEE